MLIALLALLLFAVLPWQVALLLYGPILIGSLAVSRKGFLAQRAPPASGREAMVGDQAVVTRVKRDRVEVRYRGETWRAISPQSLQPGEQVRIEAIEGLTLLVFTESSRQPARSVNPSE